MVRLGVVLSVVIISSTFVPDWVCYFGIFRLVYM